MIANTQIIAVFLPTVTLYQLFRFKCMHKDKNWDKCNKKDMKRKKEMEHTDDGIGLSF